MTADSARPRADAVRNRAKLLVAARDAFAAGEGDVTFDALARRAGVGVGTLYRNFPDRQALVEAVYRTELDAVAESAGELLDKHPADVALRRWFDRYTGFVATKKGMAEAFQQAVASGAVTAGETRERIRSTIDRFLLVGSATGALRGDVLSDDVTVALLGAVLGTAADTDGKRRGRVLDLLVDGLRPR
ncbi:TetR/AcrR family transcriptional regulator [Williamsia sterculiae]|uniref:TetR/AcrR family transcriptional regulator n=1 Tax=Williamsia sterculiae TaxID=1344003 RepID=UPI0009713A07|nr:TetR/AcrR family transcriptional regulator [Williamsia sterculiae]